MLSMNNKNKDNNLTEGNVYKTISLFALPILFGIILQSLYQTVDAIIIGRFAGKSALATIESVLSLTRLPTNFFVGLSTGATILVSQYYGAKKIDSLKKVVSTSLLFSFVSGIILSFTMILFSKYFINILAIPKDITNDVNTYLTILFVGLSPSLIYNIGAGIFRAVGNSKTPFYYLIITNIINVLLDIVFVVFLKWGVNGVALATVLSQFLSAVLIINALINTKMDIKIRFNH